MDRAPVFNLPSTIVWLALSCIALHVGRQFLDAETDFWLLLTFGFMPARYVELAALLPAGAAARWWTPLTHAFLHGDAVHLIVNLVWMAAFGSPLARRFGVVRFLLLSAICAAAGAGMYLLLYPADEVVLIGASGAISGMMAGTARFAFVPGGPLARGGSPMSYQVPAQSLMAFVTNRQAILFIAVWFGANFLFGMIGDFTPGASNPIAWEAHVGGFVAGLVIFALLDPVSRQGEPLAPDERVP